MLILHLMYLIIGYRAKKSLPISYVCIHIMVENTKEDTIKTGNLFFNKTIQRFHEKC